jgi:hypothetical protein
LRHSLRNINKIEYEHYSTSDSGHKEQAKAFLDACENLRTTTVMCQVIPNESQRRKKQRCEQTDDLIFSATTRRFIFTRS